MIKKIAIFVLVFALATAVVFTGCTPARRPYNTNQYNTGTRTGYNYGNDMGLNRNVNYQRTPSLANNWGTNDFNNRYSTGMYNNNLNNNVGFNRTSTGTTTNTDAARADEVARACERVQGVRRATAVVVGNTAYVGVDLNNTTGIANERNIKNEIAQIVRTSARDINTVYVSAEPNFMSRLTNIGNGLRSGRPVSTFTTELRDMVNRITPTRW